MNNTHMFAVGDVVSFTPSRGKFRKVEGVITEFKYKQPGKRKFARYGLPVPIQHMAIVSVETSKWTVPLDMLTFVRYANPDEKLDANNVVRNIDDSHRRAKADKFNNRWDVIHEKDLMNVKSGTPIKVRFRDRFKNPMILDCNFLGITSSNRIEIQVEDMGLSRKMSVPSASIIEVGSK